MLTKCFLAYPIVKPVPLLFVDNVSPRSSRDLPIVAVHSHMFSTRDTECLFHSVFGATEDFLDYNLIPVSLPVQLLFTGLALPFLINDLARSRVQE